MVSDRVKFYHQAQELHGHIYKKGRKYAYIVCDDNSEFKVPYPGLYKIPGAKPKQVQSSTDSLRLQFHVNDRVSFVFKKQKLQGTITRLNPKRAHIICENENEFQVSYALLTQISRPDTQDETVINRNEVELEAIAERARAIIAQHRLNQWSFQFDHGIRRAGCCQYDTHVISLSYNYAKYTSDQNIQEAILHEIAHALVGKEHNHDALWRAKAIELGCSGNRCHDIQFTPPRYIVKCQNNCWIATAERRRRGALCRTCHGKVSYMTYSEERWAKEQNVFERAKHNN